MLLIGLATGCGADSREAAKGPGPAGRQPGDSVLADNVDLPFGPEPSPSDPVKAVMACRSADRNAAELLVVVRIARAHYLHAEADHGGTFLPLKVEASLPPGVEFEGDWIFPAPEPGRGGIPVYRNTVQIKRRLKFTMAAPPSRDVTGVLRYQACNDELCWPPGKLELSASIPIPAEAKR